MRYVLLCLMALLLISGTVIAAPPEKELQGKWETTDSDSQIKLILDFGEKNTVKVTAGSSSIEAKYRFIDDENLEMTMTFNDMTATEKMKVKINGNELLLTGKESNPTKFVRVK